MRYDPYPKHYGKEIDIITRLSKIIIPKEINFLISSINDHHTNWLFIIKYKSNGYQVNWVSLDEHDTFDEAKAYLLDRYERDQYDQSYKPSSKLLNIQEDNRERFFEVMSLKKILKKL